MRYRIAFDFGHKTLLNAAMVALVYAFIGTTGRAAFASFWPDRKALTRAPKVGADGAASPYFWEWRSGQKRKLGRLSDSSLTNDRPLVDAFVAARPIFQTGPGRTFHSTR